MRQLRLHRPVAAFLATAVLTAVVWPLSADDAKPAAETRPAAEAKPADAATEADSPKEEAPGDILTEWKALDARRIEIAGKLAALQKEFATAEKARKREIRDEFQKVIFDFRSEVQPRMEELAEEVLQKDP
ncbi:MAG: hypothetical protein KDA79_23710, partial [Planctomycetaceae bacterium]|nr:hypothetical protein [Planctomycetaceae bacterium]